MINPKFKATHKDGKFEIISVHDFHDYVHALPDGDYFLTVKPAKEHEIRSNNQNRYMWGVVYKLVSEHTGFTVDEVHELMKLKFNNKVFTLKQNGVGLETFKVGQSTTGLKTNEMESYLSEIRQWASIELGCYIPLPGEVDGYEN